MKISKRTIKRSGLLIIFMASVFLIVTGFSLFGRSRAVARLVDYDCNPVSRVDLVVVNSFGPIFPMGSGHSEAHHIKTDKNGYFTFDAASKYFHVRHDVQDIRGLRYFIFERWGYRYYDDKAITIDERAQILRSTRDEPLNIYLKRPLSEGLVHSYNYDLYKFKFSDEENSIRPSSFELSGGLLLNILWRLENGLPHITIEGQGNGGVIDITENMSMLNDIPVTGYRPSVSFLIEGSKMFKVFLVQGSDKKSYSSTSIDLVYDSENRAAYVDVFTNAVMVDRYSIYGRSKKIDDPVVLQEDCGGVYARSHTGYFGRLDKEKLEYLKAGP